MSKELVVLNNPAVNTGANENDNGNWGEQEASLPEFIQLKQALTEGMDHVPNGVFFHRASGQTWTSINMVVLHMGKTRQWKPSAPDFDKMKNEQALCRSRDGKTPITNDDRLVPQAKSCDNCPKSSWAGYDKQTRTGPKPVCDKGFTFLFLDDETELPYIYNASGQGIDPSVAVYDAIRSRANVVRAKTGRMPNTYDFVVTMTSEKGNKAFKPKFTTVRQLTPEDAAKFGPLYQQFAQSRNQSASSAVIEGEYQDESEDTGAVDEPVAI